uniref:SWIM-type domain-containing protein n=1 Tax=Vitis vinifera TaxID=29760 RepID=A5BMG4_VITVI|nr:hypothetical protein VITISV_020886 [Vitis vinifera]
MLKLVNTFGIDEIELYIEQVLVRPQVRRQLLGNFTHLLLGENDNVEEFEYGCGPSSAPVAMTYECRAYENDEECESQEGDDQSEREEDVQYDGHGVFKFINEENNNVNVVSSFLALHEAMENLQHAAKLYSISANQEYVVVSSTKKLLVLRCKKAKQSQCPWKLRIMVVKGTTLFEINKHNGPHKCVNPCLNWDHQQLDSNLIVAYIQGMIKTQFTLLVAAIQAKNTKIFQRVFWIFHPSIEGFKHCRSVLSIDGTHLYGKYKDTLIIAMGCDGNNQLFPLDFALTKGENTYSWEWFLACIRTKLEAIPFEKWALSHDRGRIYDIMTTNMSEVFNSVLKRARSLPVTVLVQLKFFRLNSYFVLRREQGANQLASNEEHTSYVDAKIKTNVVKAGSHEIVLYDHIQGQFHVKTSKGTKSISIGGRTYRVNLHEHECMCGKTLIYGFPCSHILAACHFRSVDFRPLVQHYYNTQSYYNTWAPLFHPIFNLTSFLTCPQHIFRFMREWDMDPCPRPYIIRFRFYGVYRIGHITLDWGLDVAIILGFCIHGLPITGTCDIDWSLLCYELLGVTPPTYEIKGLVISTRWLCHQFFHSPVDSNDATLEQYAQAFIVVLISSTLFTDKKGLHVGQPNFGRSPAPPVAPHLDHDADDLPVEGPIGVHHGLLDEDQGLQDEALLSEGLPADLLGCFMGALHGRLSFPSSNDISSKPGDLVDDPLQLGCNLFEAERERGSRRNGGRASQQPRRSMHPPKTMLAPSTLSTPFVPEASTLPHSPLPSSSPRPSPLEHVVSDTTLPSHVFPPIEATIPDVPKPKTTPLSTNLPSHLSSLEETTTPHITSPSSLISSLIEPILSDVIAPATTTSDVILPSLISHLLDATISDITIPEITPPSTTLPSPTPLSIETTMHYTLTHATRLDVCPPRRLRGPRKHRVLPPSTPSQSIHTET